MEYAAVRIVKRTIVPPKKAIDRPRVRWEITMEGLEEPNCDVALLIGHDNYYYKLQHGNKEYEIYSHMLVDLPITTARLVTSNGQ